MDYISLVTKQKIFFESGETFSYSFRKEQLKKLKSVIKKNENEITEALYQDLHKPAMETYTTEIGFVYAEINHALKHLNKWMQPENVSTPWFTKPSSSKIYRHPLGVTLIIAPWNYPFQLLFSPLVGAIAGGNCCVLKPSEETVHTADIIYAIIKEAFNEKYISVVQGHGAEVVPALMEHTFDHIFFTGSVAVGKVIMASAAKHLTPVTLELGGKSPCIIDETADLKVAARRIVWGKFVNSGQTCVAPDYILVHSSVKEKFCSYAEREVKNFYGDNVKQSKDYPRMISKKRFDAVVRFLSDGKIIFGGETDAEQLYISPTLLDDIFFDDAIMQEEIFGPVLPVITFENIKDVPQMVNRNAYPLALYIFSSDQKNQEFIITNIRFGSGCINDTLMHLSNPSIPFGGVGTSGFGSYHGKFSFDTFTHAKGILKTPTWIDLPFRYPPYGAKEKLIRKILK